MQIGVYEQQQRDRASEVRNRLMNPAVPKNIEVQELKKQIADLKEKLLASEKIAISKELDVSDLQAIILSQAARICDFENIELRAEKKKTAKSIILEVLQNYPDVDYDDIVGRRRNTVFMEPRHACMLAVYDQRKDLSTIQMGRIFNRDHTSILNAVGKLKRNME